MQSGFILHMIVAASRFQVPSHQFFEFDSDLTEKIPCTELE